MHRVILKMFEERKGKVSTLATFNFCPQCGNKFDNESIWRNISKISKTCKYCSALVIINLDWEKKKDMEA